MKSKHAGMIGLLVFAGLALCIGAVATQRVFDDEKEVSLGELPEAVKATILAQAQGNPIDEIEMEVENGQTVYEAEVIIAGKKVEIEVAADGTLIAEEADDDDEAEDEEEEDENEVQVSLADLPEAVRKTLDEAAPGADIKELELETEDGRTQYAIDAVIGGQTFDIEIAPDGKLLQKELEDEDDD